MFLMLAANALSILPESVLSIYFLYTFFLICKTHGYLLHFIHTNSREFLNSKEMEGKRSNRAGSRNE